MESNTIRLTHANRSATSHPANGLHRRDFLRVAGITVFGLGFNLLRCLTERASGFAGVKTLGLESGILCALSERRADDNNDSNLDPKLLGQAIQICRDEKKCTTSHLQRRLNIGYGKACKLVKEIKKRG